MTDDRELKLAKIADGWIKTTDYLSRINWDEVKTMIQCRKILFYLSRVFVEAVLLSRLISAGEHKNIMTQEEAESFETMVQTNQVFLAPLTLDVRRRLDRALDRLDPEKSPIVRLS
jgi:hypothetical protein